MTFKYNFKTIYITSITSNYTFMAMIRNFFIIIFTFKIYIYKFV